MQRETDFICLPLISPSISILSLYAEGDLYHLSDYMSPYNFNPLPLCRGRHISTVNAVFDNRFQSSPSMQRETVGGWDVLIDLIKISILSLYAEGDWVTYIKETLKGISILSLYAEGDHNSAGFLI